MLWGSDWATWYDNKCILQQLHRSCALQIQFGDYQLPQYRDAQNATPSHSIPAAPVGSPVPYATYPDGNNNAPSSAYGSGQSGRCSSAFYTYPTVAKPYIGRMLKAFGTQADPNRTEGGQLLQTLASCSVVVLVLAAGLANNNYSRPNGQQNVVSIRAVFMHAILASLKFRVNCWCSLGACCSLVMHLALLTFSVPHQALLQGNFLTDRNSSRVTQPPGARCSLL